MAIIKSTAPHSPARRAGLRAGDVLISVDGRPIHDMLDYGFACAGEDPVFEVERRGKKICFALDKDADEDVGAEFESYLMDEKHSCKNNCVFCFIDQLPKGMRSTLYFKDDDERLGFLFGNYITLTNLTDKEIQRIIDMRLSPINVSVHTTDPELRKKMMNNRFAGDALERLYRLAEAGVDLNCQIVLCRGYNDGAQLDKTLSKLLKYESVGSVAVVPVGLTGHREGLTPLEPFDRESAAQVIRTIDSFGERAHAADEFYILAGEEMPPLERYGELRQLENGVGMWRLFEKEFTDEISRCGLSGAKPFDLATGEAAYGLMCALLENIGVEHRVHKIKNNFFGGGVSVAGLLCACDIIEQTAGKMISKRLFVPGSILRREGDLTLDDMTIRDIGRKIKGRVYTASDGASLVRLIGRK